MTFRAAGARRSPCAMSCSVPKPAGPSTSTTSISPPAAHGAGSSRRRMSRARLVVDVAVVRLRVELGYTGRGDVLVHVRVDAPCVTGVEDGHVDALAEPALTETSWATVAPPSPGRPGTRARLENVVRRDAERLPGSVAGAGVESCGSRRAGRAPSFAPSRASGERRRTTPSSVGVLGLRVDPELLQPTSSAVEGRAPKRAARAWRTDSRSPAHPERRGCRKATRRSGATRPALRARRRGLLSASSTL